MMELMKAKKDTTVFVGVSGGVDSSVAAFLLREEGCNVVGAFIKTWQPDFVECTWREERRDAMRVCAHLGIPFITIDAEKEYKEKVGEYMIEEYRKGRTPNPDVMCNKEVKFGIFLKKAREMGADFVVTGHYARREEINGRVRLLQGVDEKKDQSYFLWTLSQEQLKHILFPIGHLPKDEVRKIADKSGLFTSDKKDSQGVCFLGPVDMKEFLQHYIPKQEGKVLDISGNEIGTHDGALFFTFGERHGFHITKKGTSDKALYVVGKNIEENTITVSENMSDRSMFNNPREIRISNTVWNHPISFDATYSASIRYNQTPAPCRVLRAQKGEAVVIFEEDQDTFSPGQSLVVYDKGQCLGGGIIV
jgi:tRNA-specific 2-thiouridylase